MARYREKSAEVFSIFRDFTPLLEGLSLDEAFLDVSGSLKLFGTHAEIGASIKRRIQEETGLTASVGLAHNKFLAKLASDVQKPDGLVMVDKVVIGESTEEGLDFKDNFLMLRPDILVVTEDDHYADMKRELCEQVGAEYVVLPKTPPFIDRVRGGSPAEEAGLQVDDLILFVDSNIVGSCKALREELSYIDRIDSFQLTVQRGQQLKQVMLKTPPAP